MPAPPFPHFGGKHAIAEVVWERLGPVRHYLEPFAGSLGILLQRPHPPQIETVNDLDDQITNVWRALAQDPCAVAHYADRPVNELDMHAANSWLLAQQETLAERLRADLHYYDAEVAGLWIWGKSSWIGSGWCEPSRTRQQRRGRGQKPAISHTGFGVQRLGDPGNAPTSLMAAALSGRIPPRARGSWPGSRSCSNASGVCVSSAATGRGS